MKNALRPRNPDGLNALCQLTASRLFIPNPLEFLSIAGVIGGMVIYGGELKQQLSANFSTPIECNRRLVDSSAEEIVFEADRSRASDSHLRQAVLKLTGSALRWV